MIKFNITDIFSKYPTMIFVGALFSFILVLWLISAVASIFY